MVKPYPTNNLAKARNYCHINTTVDTDSDSNCEYEGGVNCEPSDDSATDGDEVWSDDESLAELEGDELEANLCALRKKAESSDAPNAFKHMMSCKKLKDWKKIEANRAFGYTKGSTRTQARRRKEAQEREASQAEAKPREHYFLRVSEH
ncbi:hypothetical protein JB92DRAFT_3109853 [Gautieria morchelliformis]|nr:hypothetical protein JB92DRAFT_3109853 [Gautieria morchelliformis]